MFYPGIYCRYAAGMNNTCLLIYYDTVFTNLYDHHLYKESLTAYNKIHDFLRSPKTDEWTAEDVETYILGNVEYRDFEWML